MKKSFIFANAINKSNSKEAQTCSIAVKTSAEAVRVKAKWQPLVKLYSSSKSENT